MLCSLISSQTFLRECSCVAIIVCVGLMILSGCERPSSDTTSRLSRSDIGNENPHHPSGRAGSGNGSGSTGEGNNGENEDQSEDDGGSGNRSGSQIDDENTNRDSRRGTSDTGEQNRNGNRGNGNGGSGNTGQGSRGGSIGSDRPDDIADENLDNPSGRWPKRGDRPGGSSGRNQISDHRDPNTQGGGSGTRTGDDDIDNENNPRNPRSPYDPNNQGSPQGSADRIRDTRSDRSQDIDDEYVKNPSGRWPTRNPVNSQRPPSDPNNPHRIASERRPYNPDGQQGMSPTRPPIIIPPLIGEQPRNRPPHTPNQPNNPDSGTGPEYPPQKQPPKQSPPAYKQPLETPRQPPENPRQPQNPIVRTPSRPPNIIPPPLKPPRRPRQTIETPPYNPFEPPPSVDDPPNNDIDREPVSGADPCYSEDDCMGK